jgi:hypothetical protein
MTVKIQVAQVIARPQAEVFQFYARDHVHNHSRWDPDMELEQESDGPIGVGTVIRRRNSHSGTPVEGTMEVVEFEPNRAMSVVIHDGPSEVRGRATMEAASHDRTILRINVEIPDMDESADTSLLTSMIERSARKIKELIESKV